MHACLHITRKWVDGSVHTSPYSIFANLSAHDVIMMIVFFIRSIKRDQLAFTYGDDYAVEYYVLNPETLPALVDVKKL